MAISNVDLDSPAIVALGSRFKLTEVFLWDDGYSAYVAQASHFPKHIRFKYDSDDNDDDNPTQKNSNSSLATAEDNSNVAEDVELTQQMSALGLPLSFQTSKQSNGQTKVKNKANKSRNKLNQKGFEAQVKGSSTLGEESSLGADAPEKPGNSSSSLLQQTDLSCSGGDLTVEFGDELVCHVGEEHIHDRKKICDDSVEQNETSVKILTAQVDTIKNEFDKKGLEIEDPGSSTTIEQAHEGSQNTAVVGNCDIDNISSSESTGDWSAFWDTFYMRYYFYNAKTQESTWDPPPGMENLALADYSCAFSELKQELNGGDEEVPNFETERVDGCALVSETCSDEQPGGKTVSDRCSSLKQEVEEVNHDECHDVFESKDLDLSGLPDSFNNGRFDGSVVVELCSASILVSASKEECSDDDINQLHQKEVETMVDEIDWQTVSTKRKKKRKNRRRKNLSNDNDDDSVELVQEFHINITKYWNQRYLLFSKFDHGIKMDGEGWFSVTPEAIAKHHASRSGGGIVIDCFVGVGGNAIQFAKVSKQVIGIDIDSSKIDYAHHNAVIYGVEEKIDFVMGDSFALATKLTADTVFLSPPWGGPDYAKLDSYDLDMLLPYDGHCLFNTFKAVASKIVMFLPRNVNIVQLAELCLNADNCWSLEVEKNYLNDKLKSVTAYYSKISE